MLVFPGYLATCPTIGRHFKARFFSREEVICNSVRSATWSDLFSDDVSQNGWIRGAGPVLFHPKTLCGLTQREGKQPLMFERSLLSPHTHSTPQSPSCSSLVLMSPSSNKTLCRERLGEGILVTVLTTTRGWRRFCLCLEQVCLIGPCCSCSAQWNIGLQHVEGEC